MFITNIYRPCRIDSPDEVSLDGVKLANDEAVLDFVFADPRMEARSSYFGAFVWYSEDDDTAKVRLYKD